MIHYDCCLPWFTNSGLRLFNHNKTWRPEEKSQPLINWVLTSNRIFCEILLKCVVIKTAAPTNVHARACPWQSQRDKVVPSGIESITNPQHPSVWTVNIPADWLTSALLSDRRTKTPHDKVKASTRQPGATRYLKHFPSAVEVLQGAGVLHRQMNIGDGQLVGKIVDVLHALLHLGQFLFK